MSADVFIVTHCRLLALVVKMVGYVLLALPAAVLAGTRPQVDLSINVSTMPVPFIPGGRSTVTLTVYNAGPDTAGGTLPNQETIAVSEDQFIITTQPPPFEIRDPVTGCRADEFVSEPLPDGNIALVFLFYFGPIPPGASRTCTYDIEFYPSTRSSFATGWRVTVSNDDDINPSNNHVDYVFQAPSLAIPTMSWQGLTGLGTGLLTIGWLARRRMLMASLIAAY